MKNSLQDLNNYLFEQIERLQDDELDEDEVKVEIQRSHAVSNVAQAIIKNADTVLKAHKIFTETGDKGLNKMIGADTDE